MLHDLQDCAKRNFGARKKLRFMQVFMKVCSMSYLSITLQRILSKYGEGRHAITQQELARLAGIHVANLSRWVNGRQVNIRLDNLEDIADAIGEAGLPEEEQVEVIIGHLKDRIPDKYRERISVSFRPKKEDTTIDWEPHLPPDLAELLLRLGKHAVSDENLRESLKYWADVYEVYRQSHRYTGEALTPPPETGKDCEHGPCVEKFDPQGTTGAQ